ncbi:alpha/beta hydrolase family protein [Streptomyces sp. NPDC090025]|uniref:alpha/beta hydrolase family protein n=1 Tax=Streptomyces sp. NPDC090025 TaxID=3365922 RepID=UPI0038366D8A
MPHVDRRTLLRLGAAAALAPMIAARAGAAAAQGRTPSVRAGRTPTGPAGPAGPGLRGLALSLPAPTGRHRTLGTVELHLIDRTRRDPLVPAKPYRELMISIWYPAERAAGHPVAPWLPAGAAADWDAHTAPGLTVATGAVDWAGLRGHARDDAPVDRRAGRLPVLLFSSGDGGSRALGTTLVEELASHGYAVVTVDATYEADQVEFPGGRVERALPLPPDLTPEVIAALLDQHSRARLADGHFVLDRIADLAEGRHPGADPGVDPGTAPDLAPGTPVRPLPAGLADALDLGRVGVLGQSLGGSVAAALAHEIPGIAAAANLDGAFVGPIAPTGLDKPLLLLTSELNTFSTEPSWGTFWAASAATGWRRALRLRGSRHGSYTDLQVLLPALAAHLPVPAAPELVGTIDPRRSLAAQRAALTAFFDLHLKHRRTSFFANPTARHPDLEVLRG